MKKNLVPVIFIVGTLTLLIGGAILAFSMDPAPKVEVTQNAVAEVGAAGVFAKWDIFLDPKIGAFLMNLSSVIVVANALTLKKAKLIAD